VSRHPHPFFRTWIVTALVAVLAWVLLPGRALDRRVLEILAYRQLSPPVEISGDGSHSEPWELRGGALNAKRSEDWSFVQLTDDLDGTFQGSPHSPIDFALIFSNLHRLGARDLACAAVLAWEDPDPVALTAMEIEMKKFKSVAIAAPVTRGAVMETLPPPFRRASVLVDDLAGNASALPVVNRVSLPNMIYGGDNVVAGFQVIDSEPADRRIPLMARWDYRVVFAFPLVTVMQRLGLEAEDLHIEVGSHIQLGQGGPSIPIDAHGRLTAPMVPAGPPGLQAAELIDMEKAACEHPVLVDSRSHGELATRNYNLSLPSTIESLQATRGHLLHLTCRRLAGGMEMPLLLVFAVLLSSTVMIGRLWQGIACLMALGLCAAMQQTGFEAGLWLPGLPASVTVLASWLACLLWGRKRRRTTPMPRLDRLKFRSLEED